MFEVTNNFTIKAMDYPFNFFLINKLGGAVKSGNFLCAIAGVKLFVNPRANFLQNDERKNVSTSSRS